MKIKIKQGKKTVTLVLDWELYEAQKKYYEQKELEFARNYVPILKERINEKGELEDYLNPDFLKGIKNGTI